MVQVLDGGYQQRARQGMALFNDSLTRPDENDALRQMIADGLGGQKQKQEEDLKLQARQISEQLASRNLDPNAMNAELQSLLQQRPELAPYMKTAVPQRTAAEEKQLILDQGQLDYMQGLDPSSPEYQSLMGDPKAKARLQMLAKQAGIQQGLEDPTTSAYTVQGSSPTAVQQETWDRQDARDKRQEEFTIEQEKSRRQFAIEMAAMREGKADGRAAQATYRNSIEKSRAAQWDAMTKANKPGIDVQERAQYEFLAARHDAHSKMMQLVMKGKAIDTGMTGPDGFPIMVKVGTNEKFSFYQAGGGTVKPGRISESGRSIEKSMQEREDRQSKLALPFAPAMAPDDRLFDYDEKEHWGTVPVADTNKIGGRL